MDIIYIPGPNNELVPAVPPDMTLRFSSSAGFAESASYADSAGHADTASYLLGSIESASYSKYAETSSFSLGFILSSSYANFAATASYLLGSIQSAVSASWAAFARNADTASIAVSSSYARNATTASISVSSSFSVSSSYARNASTASIATFSTTSSFSLRATTASYVIPGQVVVSGSGNTAGYINSIKAEDVDTATIVDSFSSSLGSHATWYLSIGDGANFRSSDLISAWNSTNSSSSYSETTTNAIGSVPVVMSMDVSAGNVRLIANPAAGNWTIKTVRLLL